MTVHSFHSKFYKSFILSYNEIKSVMKSKLDKSYSVKLTERLYTEVCYSCSTVYDFGLFTIDFTFSSSCLSSSCLPSVHCFLHLLNGCSLIRLALIVIGRANVTEMFYYRNNYRTKSTRGDLGG